MDPVIEPTPADSKNVRPKMRRRLWVALGVTVTLFAAVVLVLPSLMSSTKTFSMGKKLQAQDTELSVGQCSGDRDDKGMTHHRTGLQSTNWDEAGDFNVRYAITANCAAPFNYGGYKLEGEKLHLEYSIFWKPTEMPDGKRVVMKAACTCGYELTYRIAGLQRKNYSIEIVEVEKR